MGLKVVAYVPQLLYIWRNNKLLLIVAKVVDDILVGGDDKDRKKFVRQFADVYKIGTIVHLPGTFKFFGLLIEQDENLTIRISAQEKMDKISVHQLSRLCRKNQDDTLNSVERFSFQSVNGKLGFLGTTVSPIASFTSSHLQQTSGLGTVKDLIKKETY